MIRSPDTSQSEKLLACPGTRGLGSSGNSREIDGFDRLSNDRIQAGAKDDRDFGLPIRQLLARCNHWSIEQLSQSGSDLDLRSKAMKPDAGKHLWAHTTETERPLHLGSRRRNRRCV